MREVDAVERADYNYISALPGACTGPACSIRLCSAQSVFTRSGLACSLILVQLLASGGAVLEGYSMEQRILANDKKKCG